MPYITQEEREMLKDCPESIRSTGQLNYSVTMAALRYLSDGCDENRLVQDISLFIYFYKRNNRIIGSISYQVGNDIVGALMSSGLELSRRSNDIELESCILILYKEIDRFYNTYMVPYEDKKIKENGDVF